MAFWKHFVNGTRMLYARHNPVNQEPMRKVALGNYDGISMYIPKKPRLKAGDGNMSQQKPLK